eukprot:Pgem_evm1s4987
MHCIKSKLKFTTFCFSNNIQVRHISKKLKREWLLSDFKNEISPSFLRKCKYDELITQHIDSQCDNNSLMGDHCNYSKKKKKKKQKKHKPHLELPIIYSQGNYQNRANHYLYHQAQFKLPITNRQ